MTPYLRHRTPYPCKGRLSLVYNRGDARRSEQVKSAGLEGRRHNAAEGNSLSLRATATMSDRMSDPEMVILIAFFIKCKSA